MTPCFLLATIDRAKQRRCDESDRLHRNHDRQLSIHAWPSRDLVRAAQQQITRDWWHFRRSAFECVTSELVITEASQGDPAAAAQRLAVLADLPRANAPRAAEELAEALITAAVLPEVAARDALHVAIAAANGIEYLLTWNCRHLANATLRARIEETCEDAGLTPPIICTPEELLGDEP